MKALPLLVLLLAGCGIKANPEVLRAPEVEVRRIGDRVFLRSLSGEVKVQGFERVGSYWVKENPEAFCFLVVGERSKRLCVERALREVPSVKVLEEEAKTVFLPSGFELFHLYPLKDELPLLEGRRVIKEEFSLHRGYREQCYLLTGVRGSVESPPIKVCASAKEPPPVEEVSDLQIREGRDKLYLLWFYSRDYKEFVVYKNGKEVGRTTGFSFEVPKPEQKTTFSVKVVHPLGFESSGVSVDYSP
ncbi:MAG: hypothetical protein N3C13_02020 [Aquificaceae bacterium]|nr:hypothetical protein [Aquificaceae bacterium]MCX8059956.1 hypothetical protein [Aquificaceae bacterium]MDW8096768.1 hypothetical protein [Aquificaceae bacterium]